MKNIIIIGLLVLSFYIVLIKATDRICNKTYSQEFKQTEQYKAMQCPQ